jgi:hypothetical protein
MEKGVVENFKEKAKGIGDAVADYADSLFESLDSSAATQATREAAKKQAETVLSEFATQAQQRSVAVKTTVDADQLLAGANAAANYVEQNADLIVLRAVVQPEAAPQLQAYPGFYAPEYADGGPIKPPNAIDKLLGWFNKDEFILRAQAARNIGLSKLNYMNQTGRIPAFAGGGSVGTPINLYLPGGQSFPMSAQPSVAKQLASILGTEVLKRGRR